MSTSVAFTGWNSVQSAWNTSTWNTSLPFSLTATGAVGSATITGDANVSVTGVAGTSALGNYFTTNDMVTMTASVNSATAVTIGNANVSVTGVSATGLITAVEEFPIVWGQIIPSQTSDFSAISPSQTPSWIDVAA